MQDHQVLLDDFNFNNMIKVRTIGNSGGIVLLWDDAQLEVDEISTLNQEKHAMVKVSMSNYPCLLCCIYASVYTEEKNNKKV